MDAEISNQQKAATAVPDNGDVTKYVEDLLGSLENTFKEMSGKVLGRSKVYFFITTTLDPLATN